MVGFLLPGAHRTPPEFCLTIQDSNFGYANCLTQPEPPEHSCCLQLSNDPITASLYPGERRLFTLSSILFHPQNRCENRKEFGGGAGYRPRVR